MFEWFLNSTLMGFQPTCIVKQIDNQETARMFGAVILCCSHVVDVYAIQGPYKAIKYAIIVIQECKKIYSCTLVLVTQLQIILKCSISSEISASSLGSARGGR